MSVDANLVLIGEPFWFKKSNFNKTPPEHRQSTTEILPKHQQYPEHYRTPSRLAATPPKVPPRRLRSPKHSSETTKGVFAKLN
jgi:hypothetical protein